MTSRALSGQKDGVEVSIGSFSWALAARMELAPKPIEAAVLAGINAPSSWSLPALPPAGHVRGGVGVGHIRSAGWQSFDVKGVHFIDNTLRSDEQLAYRVLGLVKSAMSCD